MDRRLLDLGSQIHRCGSNEMRMKIPVRIVVIEARKVYLRSIRASITCKWRERGTPPPIKKPQTADATRTCLDYPSSKDFTSRNEKHTQAQSISIIFRDVRQPHRGGRYHPLPAPHLMVLSQICMRQTESVSFPDMTSRRNWIRSSSAFSKIVCLQRWSCHQPSQECLPFLTQKSACTCAQHSGSPGGLLLLINIDR